MDLYKPMPVLYPHETHAARKSLAPHRGQVSVDFGFALLRAGIGVGVRVGVGVGDGAGWVMAWIEMLVEMLLLLCFFFLDPSDLYSCIQDTQIKFY